MRLRRLVLVVAVVSCAALAVAAQAETTARKRALMDALFPGSPYASICF
jgi:hypothetical protein